MIDQSPTPEKPQCYCTECARSDNNDQTSPGRQISSTFICMYSQKDGGQL